MPENASAISGSANRLRNLFPLALVSLAVFLLYMLPPFQVQAMDSAMAPAVAASLIYEGDLTLTEFAQWNREGDDETLVWRNGDAYWFRPVAGTLLSIPFLLVLDVALPGLRGTNLHQYLVDNALNSSVALQVQGITSAAIAAISAAVVFLIARQYLRVPYALLLVAIYAFATSIYSTASRGMWMHGPAALMLSIALYLLVLARRQPGLIVWASLPLALAYMIRPTNSASVLLVTLYVAIVYRRYLLRYLLVAAVPAALLFVHSWTDYGTLLPPYFTAGRIGLLPTTPAALLDLLISPRTGLFVYSPFLLLLPAAFVLKSRRDGLEALDWLALMIPATQLVISSLFFDWWGGVAFGTRYFTDVTPYLAYLMIPILVTLQERSLPVGRHRVLAAALAVLVSLSIFIHYRGATSGAPLNWNYVPTALSSDPMSHGKLRDWSDLQFLRGLGSDLVMPNANELVLSREANATATLAYGSAADGTVDLTIVLPPGISLSQQLNDDIVTRLPDGSTEVQRPLSSLGIKQLIVVDDAGSTTPGTALGTITITGRQERRGRVITDVETITLTAAP